jgi:broad specificity phosphatase PhoE
MGSTRAGVRTNHMSGLRLVASAPTGAMRRAQFGGDDAPDEGGRNAAVVLRRALPAGDDWVSSPAKAAIETARIAGHEPEVAPALADPDFGDWTGAVLDEISTADPQGLQRWLTDPEAAPHSGESLADVQYRVGGWLDAQAGRRVVAVAHPAVVRSALAHALGLPPTAVWQLDVAPLSVSRLVHRAGRWHLYLPPVA